MKTALITGANKGIGFETARQLAQLGYFVFVGSRDKFNGLNAIQKLNESGISNVATLVLDVTNIHSIKLAKDEIEAKFNHLDVLINNAGIRGDVPQPASQVSIDTLRIVFETNFFGAVQVTQQFLSLLKNSIQPTIVNVTSDLSSLTNQSDPHWKFAPFKPAAYAPSKTALNAYTVLLASEFKDTNFKINCVNPGHTATDFNDFKGKNTIEYAASILVSYATPGKDGETGKFYSEEGVSPW